MRISSHSIADTLARAVANSQTEYADEQVRIATGNKHQTRSDDAVATSRAARLEQTQTLARQFSDNIGQASSWTSVTETSLDSIVDSVARAQEIGVEANDATLSDASRKALVSELDGIIEDLVSQANAEFADTPLFGGIGGETPVVEARDADGRITGVAYAAGCDTVRTVQVAENATVSCGVAATGTTGAFADSATGRDLFQSLIDLRDEIEANGSISDTTLEGLATAADGTTQALVQTGLQTSRLGTLELRGQAMDTALQENLSELSDTDMAAAISRLSELEASLTASLQLASRVGQLSLVNYI